MFIFSYSGKLEENGTNFVGLFNSHTLPLSIKKITVSGGAMISASVLYAGVINGENISESIVSTGLDDERVDIMAFKNPSFTIDTKSIKHTQIEKGLPYEIIDEEDELILPVGKSIIIRVKPYINPTGGTCTILFSPMKKDGLPIKDEIPAEGSAGTD